ncbi:MAG: crossover junction endodeoxyribonuclease RuvC [Myxococcota bacterium]
MIAFGIDPGSIRTGFGVVRVSGSRIEHLGDGVIRAPESAPLSDRVEAIFTELCAELDRHRPEQVFLESLFHHKNAKSALVLGHARGVALLAVRMRALPLDELAPSEVKKAVTGNGRAEKFQVQEMVRMLLGLPKVAPVDASDALAIAIAGAYRARSPIWGAAERGRGTR